MLEFIDTHIHLDDERYQEDLPEVLVRARQAGVSTLINAGSTVEANVNILKLLQEQPELYGAVGLHPHEFPAHSLDVLKTLPLQLAQEKIVALGEIGLDYHVFPDYPAPDHDAQQQAFRAQLRLARIFELPLIVHVREAMEDALRLLREEGPFPQGGVLHCYSSGVEDLPAVLNLGFFIGIGGPVTYPKAEATRQAVRAAPLERLLLETDAPYLPPQSHRGQRHEPAWMLESAAAVAELRGLSLEQLAQATSANAKGLFKLGPIHPGTIVYDIQGHLYINLTNRCSSHCRFCPRKVRRQVRGYDLTLKREPLAKEIITAIGDPKDYAEIVFCGFGEPTLRLPVLLEVARAVKAKGGRVRVNSNGQADKIFEHDILPACQGLVDTWSISVNTINEQDYMRMVQPATGAGTLAAVMDFARRAAADFEVVISDVDMPGIDLRGLAAFAQQIGARYRGRHYQQLGEPEE